MTTESSLRWVIPVRRLKQLIFALTAALLGFLYVWFAAVRAVPGVRRRKAAARAAGTAATRRR